MNKRILNISACAFLMGLVACSDDGKTAGVTEDDNAIAQNGSSSSFSGDAEPKFDLWNGADGLAQVNLGDEKVGYWYSFNDKDDGGSSRVVYPVPMGNDYSATLDPVVEHCEGMCGTVELNNLTSQPMAGVGIAVAEEGSTADISAWNGLCVTYESDFAITLMLGVVTAGDSMNWASPYVTLPKAKQGIVTRCAKWSDFAIPVWANTSSISQVGELLNGEEAAKQVKAILFMFNGKSDESGKFNIKGISSYDENLPQWDTPVSETLSSSSVNRSSSSSINDASTCLWNGSKKEYPVNTGFDPDGEHMAGYWYSYDDNQDGGISKIEWPEVCTEYDFYDDICLDAMLDYCKGICGKMYINRGPAYEAVLGVAFNVAGFENPDTDVIPMTADISDWGGICVTFKSELNLFMRLGVDSLTEVIIELGKTKELEEKCFTWDDFDEDAEDPQMPAKEAAKKVRNIKFGKRSGESMIGTFTIAAIGKYSANGACSVDGARSNSSRDQSSSSQVAMSSSSSVKSSSSYGNVVYEDTCGFYAGDDLWFGPNGIVPVETGFDSGTETSGYWFKIEDRGSAENSKVVWPVALGDEYDDESFAPLIEYCMGVCATLDFRNAYFAGVGFHVADATASGALTTADATEWGGLCVTYASEGDVDIVLNKGDHDEFFKPNLLPTATLPKSELLQMKCVPWIGFKDYEGKEADVTKLSSVYFLVNGEAGTKSKINIFGLGTYKELTMDLGQCREKDVFVSQGK